MKCDNCGRAFLNYQTEEDWDNVHPETGSYGTIHRCPHCSEIVKRVDPLGPEETRDMP